MDDRPGPAGRRHASPDPDASGLGRTFQQCPGNRPGTQSRRAAAAGHRAGLGHAGKRISDGKYRF